MAESGTLFARLYIRNIVSFIAKKKYIVTLTLAPMGYRIVWLPWGGEASEKPPKKINIALVHLFFLSVFAQLGFGKSKKY